MFIGFEAIGIHDWFTAGGKLNDIAGGSEVLQRLISTEAKGDLRHTLEAIGVPADQVSQVVLFNQASRFNLRLSEEHATAFYEAWPMIVRQRAPHLEFAFVQASTVSDLMDGLKKQQRRALAHPLPGPMVARAQRTRVTAIANRAKAEAGEVIDAATSIRRKAVASGDLGILDRRLKKLAGDQGMLPTFLRDADDLAESFERRSLAYIYIDGSGIGDVFGTLNKALETGLIDEEQYVEAVRAFSTALDDATFGAVIEALKSLRQKWRMDVPMRPILIGGDDVSLILPSVMGYDFCCKYMHAFSAASRNLSGAVKQKLADAKISLQTTSPNDEKAPALHEMLPEQLNIGCGLAFVGPHFPADQAIGLAESLCNWAKAEVGRATSAFAFHRVTGSFADAYGEICRKELSFERNETRYALTAGPYLVDSITSGDVTNLQATSKGLAPDQLFEASSRLSGYLTIDYLRDLLGCVNHRAVPHGPQRKILALAYEDPDAVPAALQRIREVADKQGGGHRSGDYSGVVMRMLRLLENSGQITGGSGAVKEGQTTIWKTRRPVSSLSSGDKGDAPVMITPFGDIHTLLGAARRSGDNTSDAYGTNADDWQVELGDV